MIFFLHKIAFSWLTLLICVTIKSSLYVGQSRAEIASHLHYIVMQMSKTNREKGHSTSNDNRDKTHSTPKTWPPLYQLKALNISKTLLD